MTIYEQLKELLHDRKGEIVTSSYVKDELQKKYNTNPKSVLLSDFCYNRFNKGIDFDKHLFRYISRNLYEYLGEKVNYTGLIYQKPATQKEETVAGEWRNGKKYLYENANNKKGTEQISREQIVQLFHDYIEILRVEMLVLKCQPTELRHLTGRIGEFYCAITLNGKLTRTTNQHGFDVIANNRKISVKTTAQTTGFISINQNTFKQFDDLFVVQYLNDDFKVIFYGPKEEILDIARTYNTNYEVEIRKLIKKETKLKQNKQELY